MEVGKLDIDKWFTPSEIKYIGRGGSAEKVTTQIVLESGFLDCPTTHWRSVGKRKASSSNETVCKNATKKFI